MDTSRDFIDRGWNVESCPEYVKAVSPDGAVYFAKKYPDLPVVKKSFTSCSKNSNNSMRRPAPCGPLRYG